MFAVDERSAAGKAVPDAFGGARLGALLLAGGTRPGPPAPAPSEEFGPEEFPLARNSSPPRNLTPTARGGAGSPNLARRAKILAFGVLFSTLKSNQLQIAIRAVGYL